MPPKVQVSKDTILNTAMELVFREGPDVITYQALAKELGRSTQTIAWKFGSIGNLLDELAEYILDYFNTQIIQGWNNGKNPIADFTFTEEVYLKLAFEQPNLVQFVRSHSTRSAADGGVGFVFDQEKSKDLRQYIVKAAGINDNQAADYIKNIVIYAHGLVSMAVDRTINIAFEDASAMIRQASITYLVGYGVPEDMAVSFFGENNDI
ncbi:MAG: TetR/AcrR family transcriptional regulator [Pseudobutyrivibrio sp.]|nr:TetR/AcrR family transcriptional regulator [Pseudobutyrivibrio sp.]